jgi:hypothetical protein
MKKLELRYSDSVQHVVYIGGRRIGKFLMDESGQFCYYPDERLIGYWPSYQIRMIADKLDEINKVEK